MAVEIYLEPELLELTKSEELTSDWKKLCEDLGLEGQQKMLPNKDANPSPYLFMNSSLMNMFSVLCPSVEHYTKYNKSTIPYEVLKEIAICKEKNYFDSIKIWYDDISPDPVVVGYMKNDGDYNETRHLIARFGDEVLPFEILRQKAKKRISESIKNELSKSLSTLEEISIDLLNGKSSFSVSYNPLTWNHQRL